MLEIRNVSKTYRPKKGVPVKALDDVSLSFADTGLVFILGKSGSGKSTLLNVIGGLDVADSGEFIIKGKSSKDFTQADFDSYRNTFIGFIFQEYNILNEFSVGQNIALAMKLQGKKVDDGKLNEILDEVDLAGYATRKPNELSGGQKQRVAIARALIKEPEIIMADEPTGALDSNTGRQVFDTLKKLSKTKLVIVVSHDREFAEYYGDRVIELADGRVISDITKETSQSEKQSEGISLVDDRIFHIRKGYKLTSADMKKIQAYIDNADSDTIISFDERSNASFCQIARIDKDGNQEVFKDTDNSALAKENEKYDGTSEFIRSRLPLSHAFRIGSSSLRTKPIRLIITILLCFVSFALFGLADTIGAFNARKTTLNSILDSNYDSVVFSTKIDVMGDGWYRTLDGCSDRDLERIQEQTGMTFNGVLSMYNKIPIYDSSKLYGVNNSSYYNQQITGALIASEAKFAEYGFGEVVGSLPNAIDEVVITNYVYDQIALGGLVVDDENIIKSDKFDSIESFLALKPVLSTDYGDWKIVGVIDTKADEDGRFDEYKPSDNEDDSNIMDFLMSAEMRQYFEYGYHSLIYVSPSAYEELYKIAISGKEGIGYYAPGYFSLFSSTDFLRMYSNFSYVATDEALSKLDVVWVDGNERTSLADNEFVMSIDSAYWLLQISAGREIIPDEVAISYEKTYFDGLASFSANFMKDIDDSYLLVGYFQSAEVLADEQVEAFRSLLKSKTDGLDIIAQKFLINQLTMLTIQVAGTSSSASCNSVMTTAMPSTLDELTINQLRFLYVGYLSNDTVTFVTNTDSDDATFDGGLYVNPIGECGKVTQDLEYKKLYYTLLFDNVSYNWTMDGLNIAFDANGYGAENEYGIYKVVGLYIPRMPADFNGTEYYSSENIIINNYVYEQAQSVEPLVYSFFIAPMPKGRTSVDALLDIHYDKSQSRGFVMRNGVIYTMDMVSDVLEVMGKVFLWVGVGLAVFSMLLLSNYIAVSITYKKREIGILRAVGARSSDVFSIFFSESLIIALINFVIAFVVCLVGCSLINSMLRNDYGFDITLLNFGFRQFILMLVISVGVAIVASFLPVYKLSRKKPIETIRTA